MGNRYQLALAALLLHAATLAGAADEWRFASTAGPNGNTIFLAESPSLTKGCKGKQDASEQMYALGKWTYLRDLCYEVDKAGIVKLTDPERMTFFNTFTIHSSKFTSIPTEKERNAEKLLRDQEDQSRGMSEMLRQYNETQNNRQQRRRPVICDHIGSMSYCD